MSWHEMRLVVQVYAEERHGTLVRDRMRLAKEIEDRAFAGLRKGSEG